MPHVANALFAKVLVALLSADEAAARSYLTRQRAAHTERVRELTTTKIEASSVGDAIAADYAIAHLGADLVAGDHPRARRPSIGGTGMRALCWTQQVWLNRSGGSLRYVAFMLSWARAKSWPSAGPSGER